MATLEWVAWFNHRRLLESIGYTRRQRPRQTTTGYSPVKPLPWWSDLNQTASTGPRFSRRRNRQSTDQLYVAAAFFNSTTLYLSSGHLG